MMNKDNCFYIVYCVFTVAGKSVMHDNMTKNTYYASLNDVYLELVNQIQLLKSETSENEIKDFVNLCKDLNTGDYCKIKLDNNWDFVVEKHSYNAVYKGVV